MDVITSEHLYLGAIGEGYVLDFVNRSIFMSPRFVPGGDPPPKPADEQEQAKERPHGPFWLLLVIAVGIVKEGNAEA